jgi:hypothetical protein
MTSPGVSDEAALLSSLSHLTRMKWTIPEDRIHINEYQI